METRCSFLLRRSRTEQNSIFELFSAKLWNSFSAILIRIVLRVCLPHKGTLSILQIVIVIPAFNEEKTIGQVIKQIPRNVLSGNRIIIVVVDDGSCDRTGVVAKRAGADFVVRHKENQGLARAFKTGLKAAKKLNADLIVNIDADGQFDPKELPDLIEPIIAGRADAVMGSRFIGKDIHNIPSTKRVANTVVTFLVGLLVGKRFSDTQCGFRALSMKTADKISLSGVFTYTQEMVLEMAFNRIKIVEVPVSVTYHGSRTSRVVSSISRYGLKVIGIILIPVLRHFGKHLASVFMLLSILLLGSLMLP